MKLAVDKIDLFLFGDKRKKNQGISYGEMAKNGGYVMEAEEKLTGYFMES